MRFGDPTLIFLIGMLAWAAWGMWLDTRPETNRNR